MGQARRRAAKAERAVGPVRFAPTPWTRDAGRVIELKRAQYRQPARGTISRTGRRAAPSATAHPRPCLRRGAVYTARGRSSDSGALRHALRPRSALVVPGLRPRYARLAPGWILLRELVAAAPQLDQPDRPRPRRRRIQTPCENRRDAWSARASSPGAVRGERCVAPATP